jgi:hypothetical protein
MFAGNFDLFALAQNRPPAEIGGGTRGFSATYNGTILLSRNWMGVIHDLMAQTTEHNIQGTVRK